jgi:tetratricopeptide (TPR) repeat protein
VGAWYRGLEADRVAPSAEVKAKAAELVAGKTTNEEKVRSLYGYVSTQIRYIGVAFGVGRYQPHTAAEILSNQYGDCKDKHTLLAAMLGAVGMDADAVLIGAGVRFNEAVPSPAAFNHVITHLTVAGQPVWLDSTAEIAPYRMLVSVIRDRQALVVPAVGAVRIERTPAEPPFASFQTMKAVGTLDKDGVSMSRITYATRGDEELIYRAALRQVAPAQYGALIQQISLAMGYQGIANNPEFGSSEQTSEPLTFSYDYRREQGGDWEHYKIIPQLRYNSLPLIDEKNPPVRTIDLGVPRTELSSAEMKIPEAWGAVLPEATHAKSDFATLDETYRFDKGVVYADLRVVVLKEKLPVNEWKAYQKWTDDAGLTNQVFIQLVRHDPKAALDVKLGDRSKELASVPTTSASEPAPSVGANAAGGDAPRGDPAKLLQEAYASLQERDINGATKLLDEAKAVNPEFNGLWAMYGLTALQHYSAFDAIEDFRKELKLHPDFYQAYPMLLQAHKMLDQHKEMEDTLREWAAAETSNPAPSTQLMEMLIGDGDGASALAAGESALTHLPEEARKNERFQLTLGEAEIAAGEKGKGSAALEALLKTSQDAGVLNDTAYVLADASLDLALAENSARGALEKLAEESNTWTLDENPQTLLAKTNLAVATWDTLGWALFREGKLEEAESYLKAGWAGSLNVETGRHLGEVQAARGDKSGALTTYELAIASEPGYNSLGVRKEPSAKVKELQARAEALRRAGAKSSAGVAQNGLLELRKVALGAADGRSGDAEYKLLLKGGKAVKVEQSGSKSVAGAEETISKASFARLFPAGSPAVLVRAGYVNCHSGVCELLLEPLR